ASSRPAPTPRCSFRTSRRACWAPRRRCARCWTACRRRTAGSAERGAGRRRTSARRRPGTPVRSLGAVTGTRLTANDWVTVGFAVRGEQGIKGIKIDRMAERLGVTKGSFYWHFRDLDDFLDALTTKWAEEMGTRYLATAGSPDEPPSIRMQNRLRVFLS